MITHHLMVTEIDKALEQCNGRRLIPLSILTEVGSRALESTGVRLELPRSVVVSDAFNQGQKKYVPAAEAIDLLLDLRNKVRVTIMDSEQLPIGIQSEDDDE